MDSIIAKGGKASLGQSSSFPAYVRGYCAAIAALPPANSNANAKLHRQVLVKFYPQHAELFVSLGLDF